MRPLVLIVLLASAALAGCGKSEEEIEPAPVAQLQGPWQMINRSATCETSYTVITPTSMVKLFESGARKKYAEIKKFTLAPGKVILLTTGLHRDAEKEISVVFALADNKLRVENLLGPQGESYKEPPQAVAPEEQVYMKTLFRLQEQRFAMDKCVGA